MAARAASVNKFDGDIFAVISLVDSRHDFKATSQDTGVQIGDYMDCFQNFTNNIQREVLELDIGYSQRLTSTCKGAQVMRQSPEDEFLQYIEDNCSIPRTPGSFADVPREGAEILRTDGRPASPGWNLGAGRIVGKNFRKYVVRASHFGLNVIDAPGGAASGAAGSARNYEEYHAAIARRLGYVDNSNIPIPLVVDTTRTLTHDSNPYFIICRNKESVADPSNTSTMRFPFLALESEGNARREYMINNVRHRVQGALESPQIEYSFVGDAAAAAAPAAVYDFGAAAGTRKPNEIEVCKGKIKEVVNQVIFDDHGNQRRLANYQNLGSISAVARLIDLFNADCGIYNNLRYNIHNNIKKQIAIPYIAKRGGDQLQVESCLQPIQYNTRTIQNAVFWTIDRVAACYAILRGVTTVLQLPTKDVVIYKREDYIPVLKDEKRKNMRGGVCTRQNLQNLLRANTNITDECFLTMYKELCRPFGTHYDPFTLLNLIYYISTINSETSKAGLNGLYRAENLQLDLNKCIIQVDSEGNPESAGRQNFILSIPENSQIYSLPDKSISILGTEYNFSSDKLVDQLYGIVQGSSTIASRLLKQAYFRARFGREMEIDNNNGAAAHAPAADENVNMTGGGSTFYDDWLDLQKHLTMKKANTLFIDFIDMLALAENQYFLHKDLADNFYIYNPYSAVTHGGHSQIEMMAFLSILIEEYKQNLTKRNVLVKCFVYFPQILKKLGYEIILTDIYNYLNMWFEYDNISSDITIDDNVFKMIEKLIEKASAKSKEVQQNMSIDDRKCADYLFSEFRHGYFVIKYQEITNSKKASLISKKRSRNNNKNKNSNTTRRTRRKLNTNMNLNGGKYLTRKRRNNKGKSSKKYKL